MDSLTDEKFTDTQSKVLPVAESFNASGVTQQTTTDSLLWLPATSINNEFRSMTTYSSMNSITADSPITPTKDIVPNSLKN
jgi:hypothetical protein